MAQVAKEAAEETVKQIKELAVKSNKTAADKDLLKDLVKKSTKQQQDIAAAESRQRSDSLLDGRLVTHFQAV